MTIDSAKKLCAILSNSAQPSRPPPLFIEETSGNCVESGNETSESMLVSSSEHKFQSVSNNHRFEFSYVYRYAQCIFNNIRMYYITLGV